MTAIQIGRAREKIDAAGVLAAQGYADDAISRAYYAIYHAASAALLCLGVSVKTHDGLKTMFGLHLVKPGAIESDYARTLGRLKDDRENGDYDLYTTFEDRDAHEAIANARKFVDRIVRYLMEEQGFTSQQLTE